MVITPKHVWAVLAQILIILLKKTFASVGVKHFIVFKCTVRLENYTFLSARVHKTCRLFRTILHSLCWVSCTCSSHDVCPPSLIIDFEVETAILLLQFHKTGSLTAVHFFKPGLCVLTPFIYDFLQFFLHFFWLLPDGQPQVLSDVVEGSRHV
jgi:hypothetical protein